ncbi:mpv17-like protein [Convolutriloba macropyga]|uniref:mpv17-like protein n=1 Tax=Convolutriloba macropyga TaxID=536237 RepID=UPI003F520238
MAATSSKQVASMYLKNIGLMTSFFSVAEVIQQKFVFKKEKVDFGEVFRLGTAIAVWSAPVNCLWYFKLLNKVVPTLKTPMKTAVARAAVDPVICLPFSNIGLYTIMDTLAGKEDRFEQVKSKFPVTYASGIAFWVPVQIINFRFFPVHLRVAFVSGTAFIWSNILCYIKNSDTVGTKKLQST